MINVKLLIINCQFNTYPAAAANRIVRIIPHLKK